MSSTARTASGAGVFDGLAQLAQLGPAGGHRTLAEKAFDILHEAIVHGVVAPGQRLPIEELAEVLGMSPMPIREAIRRLDGLGLLENVPHRGARAAALTVDDLLEVYEVRLELEPLAVERASLRLSEGGADTAATRLDDHLRFFRSGDMRASWEAHTAFHFTLYEAAGSRWLLRLITPLWQSSERYRYASLPNQRAPEQRRGEHEAILLACRERDPERAALQLHNHLVRTANAVSVAMGGHELFALEG